MNVLHIVSIGENTKNSGIAEVIKQYYKYQKKYIKPYIYNTKESKFKIEGNYFSISDVNVFELIKREKIQLIIYHGVYFTDYIKISKKVKKIPYIILPHGSLTKFAQKKSFIKKKIGNFLIFNKFIRNASCIHFLTDSERIRSIIKMKNFVIPNGIETREEFNIKKKRNNSIVFIGRKDIYIKGIDYLLNEIMNNKNELYNLKIFLYGPDRRGANSYINKFIKKYNLEKILYNEDSIHGEDKFLILSEALATILTSRTEGHPTVLLESLSVGTPIIASVGTGMDKFIDKYNCGWHFQNKKNELSNILKEINNVGIDYEKNTNSRICSLEEFNWDDITLKTIKEYNKIVSKEGCQQ